MHRLVPLLLLLLISLPVQAAQPCQGGKLKSPNFKLPNVRLKPGAHGTLKLTAKHLDGLGFDIVVKYDDTVAQITNVTAGPNADGHAVIWNIPEDGVLRIAMFGPQQLSGNGTLLLIDLVVSYDIDTGGPGLLSTPLVLDVIVDEGAVNACTTNGVLKVG